MTDFHYDTLSEAFWYYSDPLQEAQRLLDLYDELVLGYGRKIGQILNDAKTIIKKHPSDDESTRLYGILVLARISYFKRGPIGAISKIKTILTSDPDHEDALEFLTEISKNNNPAPILRLAGFQLLKKYRETQDLILFHRALKLADRALQAEPDIEKERSYYLMAAIHRDFGDNERAIKCLIDALSCNPDHGDSLKLLARLDKDSAIVHHDHPDWYRWEKSPEGSEIAEFMKEFNNMFNWDLQGPRFV